MKYVIERTNQFKSDFKLAIKQGLDIKKIESVIEKLANGEKLPNINRDHELKGDYKGYRECHIESDWILIYKINEDIIVLSLVRTGTHSRLFKR